MPSQYLQSGVYIKIQWDSFEWMTLQEAPWTQDQLCEASGRSKQSVYWILKRLVKEGKVIKLTPGHAHRGRPHLYECALRRQIIRQMCENCLVADLKKSSASPAAPTPRSCSHIRVLSMVEG